MRASRDWTRWLLCGESRRAQRTRWATLDLVPEAARDARALSRVADYLRGCEWVEDSPPRSAGLAAVLADNIDMLASEIADGAEGVSGGLLEFDSNCDGRAGLRLDDRSVARAGADALRDVADKLNGAASEARVRGDGSVAALAGAFAAALVDIAASATPKGAPPCHPRRDPTDAERAEWTEMRAAGQRAVEQAGAWGERAEDAARTLRQAASKETRPAREAFAAVARAAGAVDPRMLAIIRHALATGDPDWPCPLPPPRTSPAESRVWSSAFESAAAVAQAEQALGPADIADHQDADTHGATRAALAQLAAALEDQAAAADGLANEAIADTRALAEARRAIEQPLPTEHIEAAVQMLREVAREPVLDIGVARRAVGLAAQAVDGGMLAVLRRALASDNPDGMRWQPPRGLGRAEERAWTFVRGCASVVAFAESSLDYANDASGSYPAPNNTNDDARRAVEALAEFHAIAAEEAREALLDLIRALAKASSWASLRGAIALRGGGSVPVAGVLQHQDTLRALGGYGQSRGVTALLVAEPNNPHDRNAIAVYVASRGARRSLAERVGYIPRDRAAAYAKTFESISGTASGGFCDGAIVGGHPLFEGGQHRNRVRSRRGRAAKTMSRTIPSGKANLGLRLDLAEPGAILTPRDR